MISQVDHPLVVVIKLVNEDLYVSLNVLKTHN